MPINRKLIKKILFFAVLLLLAAAIFYLGASCAMTLWKVFTQPHLESAASNYSFLGFLFLALLNGVGALAAIAAMIAVIYIFNKKSGRLKAEKG